MGRHLLGPWQVSPRYARTVAQELIDLINRRGMRHSLLAWPKSIVTIARYHPSHGLDTFNLIGVYDERADITRVVEDILSCSQ